MFALSLSTPNKALGLRSNAVQSSLKLNKLQSCLNRSLLAPSTARRSALLNAKPDKKVVADTSDEDSYLPEDPIDLDEEIILPHKVEAREMYDAEVKRRSQQGEQHKKQHEEHEEHKPQGPSVPWPASREASSVESGFPRDSEKVGGLGEGGRVERMAQAERDVTKMEPAHHQEEDANKGAQASFPPSATRATHELHRAQHIDDNATKQHSEHPVHDEVMQERFSAMVSQPHQAHEPAPSYDVHVSELSSSSDTSSSSSFDDDTLVVEGAYPTVEQMKREDPVKYEKQEHDTEKYFEVADKKAAAENIGEFNFKGFDPKEKKQNSMEDDLKAVTKSEEELFAQKLLESLKDKQEKSSHEMNSVNRLNKRIAQVRELHDAHHDDVKTQLESRAHYVTFMRLLETSAGRAALLGMPALFLSETWYRQSVLSQLLGRWDGRHQVEFAIPEAQNAVIAVLVGALLLTSLESVLKRRAPPAVWWFGLPPMFQLWVGRGAMFLFAAVCLYETMHSNRPVFPFWFVIGH